jgi:hypothetical protein
MSDRNPDRLGDAIRELARAMAENGRTYMQLHIVSPDVRAVYEIRLLRTIERGVGKVPGRRRRHEVVHIIETEAFGPGPRGSRQKADNSKE